ncbi:MAG: hypothetical protein ACE366_16415 [Bradymonadia bacterium]
MGTAVPLVAFILHQRKAIQDAGVKQGELKSEVDTLKEKVKELRSDFKYNQESVTRSLHDVGVQNAKIDERHRSLERQLDTEIAGIKEQLTRIEGMFERWIERGQT